jgi:hypothetical protein
MRDAETCEEVTGEWKQLHEDEYRISVSTLSHNLMTTRGLYW